MGKKSIFLSAFVLFAATLFAEEKPAAQPTGKTVKSTTRSSDNPFPENPTFLQVRCGFIPEEKLATTETARMVYYISADKLPPSYVMIQAKRYDKVRVDILVNGKLFTSVRNGDKFWYYSQKTGAHPMSEYDAVDFAQFIAFLPIPFYKEDIFDAPVFKEEQTTPAGTVRTCFSVNTHDNSDAKYELLVDNKTKLLRRVEQVYPIECAWGTSYQSYRNFGGIRIPAYIITASMNMNYTLTLVSADWNLDLDDTIFNKAGTVVDEELALFMEFSKSVSPKITQEVKNDPQGKIEKLEHKIAKLKQEIANEEEKRNKLDKAYTSNRSQAVGLASNNGGGGTNFWHGGWSSGGGRGRDSYTRRRLVKGMELENAAMASEYRMYTSSVHQKRMELLDLEFQLKQLKKEAEKKEETDKELLKEFGRDE